VPTIKAEFDGRAFVPCQAVDLPVGTKVEVIILGAQEKPTPEELRQWEEIRRELESSEPFFPTVEEALRYSRKRPS
jgi:hypothetical protein